MKTSIIALVLFFPFVTMLSQISLTAGKTVQNVTITNSNDEPVTLTDLGKKTVVIFYTDPDVKDVNDPLSDAIKARKYPSGNYLGLGIGNCADTWLPNSAIRYAARQKEKDYPGSVVLIDTDHLLSKAWGLGDCDDIAVVIIIGKDLKVKYIKTAKTQDDSKAMIGAVIKILDEELLKK